MKLAVVGGGAMGGTLAAEAADAGHEVAVLDVSAALVDRINADGITVDGPRVDGGTGLHAAVTAATTAEAIGVVDVAVVFVKAAHTASAAVGMAALLGESTVVVTLQNGWGNADVLADVLPPERLVIGVTYHSCTIVGPAHLAHTGRGASVVGPYLAESGLEAAGTVATLLGDAGWPVDVTTDVRTEIWKKLVLNSATLPTAALTRLSAGAVGEPGPLLDLVDALAAETVAVARAQGLDIELAERLDRIHTVLANAGKGKASMLADVKRQSKTEVETINLAVVRAGAAHGVATPLNQAMVALIGGLERSWSL